MARRTRYKKQHEVFHALRTQAARSTLDAQLQPLFLPLELPPQRPPPAPTEAIQAKPEGSCVIVIDLA
jgi:hypothetical protein